MDLFGRSEQVISSMPYTVSEEAKKHDAHEQGHHQWLKGVTWPTTSVSFCNVMFRNSRDKWLGLISRCTLGSIMMLWSVKCHERSCGYPPSNHPEDIGRPRRL